MPSRVGVFGVTPLNCFFMYVVCYSRDVTGVYALPSRAGAFGVTSLDARFYVSMLLQKCDSKCITPNSTVPYFENVW